MTKYLKIFSILFAITMLAACSGGSGDTPPTGDNPETISKIVSGVAAAGAPIIGTVTVKGALGETKSVTIEADGNYNIDVTGLTAPYRLRAQGTVGGKTYQLHSYAQAADVGGVVNITPFTDLIIANAAQQIAEAFFDTTIDAGLDSTVIDAQETALQAKLQDVLDVLGVETAIDLLNSSFSADHTGLDAALDIIMIEVDPDFNTATITNLFDNSSIEDNLLDGTDNSESLTVTDVAGLVTYATDTEAIAALFANLSAKFVGGLPTPTAIENFFATDFLTDDQSKGELLTMLTTDPSLVDLRFASVSVSGLDSDLGTATVKFNMAIGARVDPETDTWLVAKDATLGWQCRGNQRIVELEELSFHCNDYDGTDGLPGGCGVNVSFRDNDFTNNGTISDAPIASGTVTLIDGTDGTTKDIIYLGTPATTAPGDGQVYNEATGTYQWDWRAFGVGVGEIDSAIFAVGDIIEYKLYEGNLDLTAAPAVVGPVVATYTNTLSFVPSTTALYPTATPETLTAMQNFTMGSNLIVAWTLAAGTVSDEVMFVVSDDQGNRSEIWEDTFAGSSTNSITLATTAPDSTNLDPLAVSYQLVIRIYAMDEVTGQEHSIDYRTTIPGPMAGGGETTTPAASVEFTAAILDAGLTYYVSYVNGSGDTDQEAIAISGSGGTYTVIITEDLFTNADVFISNSVETISVVLNGDGTITATHAEGTTLLMMTAATADFYTVSGVDYDVSGVIVDGPWYDNWYFAPPAGWLQ